MTVALTVSNLDKSFGRIVAVSGISFEVQQGEIFALIGPNGAGKSTTLRMIATLLSPSHGNATVFGHNVHTQPESVRALISYLPEEAGAYKNMRGKDYLHFIADLCLADPLERHKTVEYGIKLANLGNRINDKVGTYSKGMTRKLLLARSVMTKPKLAILDEPTSGLDVTNAISIRQTIRELANQGLTVLLSSHNMLEIEYLSDRVGIISQGKLRDVGTSAELKKKYQAKNLEEVFVAITK